MAVDRCVQRLRLEAPNRDLAWWRSRTPAERIAALELIRQEYNRGVYGADTGLQRVCRIVKQV